jgi:hypothetical protein
LCDVMTALVTIAQSLYECRIDALANFDWAEDEDEEDAEDAAGLEENVGEEDEDDEVPCRHMLPHAQSARGKDG